LTDVVECGRTRWPFRPVFGFSAREPPPPCQAAAVLRSLRRALPRRAGITGPGRWRFLAGLCSRRARPRGQDGRSNRFKKGTWVLSKKRFQGKAGGAFAGCARRSGPIIGTSGSCNRLRPAKAPDLQFLVERTEADLLCCKETKSWPFSVILVLEGRSPQSLLVSRTVSGAKSSPPRSPGCDVIDRTPLESCRETQRSAREPPHRPSGSSPIGLKHRRHGRAMRRTERYNSRACVFQGARVTHGNGVRAELRRKAVLQPTR